MVKFKEYFRNTDILLIDDIQFMNGKEAMQEEFFHTFNALLEKGSQIILSADRSPNKLLRIQERIKSRFSGGLVVDIQNPDYDLRYEILKLYGTYSIPRIGQVLFVYLGEITNEDFYACDETQEVKLFEVDKIPWEDIAFPSVKFFIEKYVLDYNDDLNFKFHSNYA